MRLRWLDARGVDVQIVAAWTDLSAYHLAPDVGVAWCRMLNDTLAAAVADEPRLVALAALPLQDPHAASEMLALAEVRAAGFVGAMIGTQVDGHELDHADLDPVWATAARVGLPLSVHPMFANDARLPA